MAAHGSISRYCAGCRCDECRETNRVYRHEGRLKLETRSRTEVPHGIGGYRNWRCRCEICEAANVEDHRSRQRRTVDQARRRGQQWTGPELELAARPDLTAEQVAQMTGRTYSGVIMMRRRLRMEDPRVAFLAGTDTPSGFGIGKGRKARQKAGA